MDKPIWQPSIAQIKNCNLQQYKFFLQKEYKQFFATYNQLHTWSINNREIFWESIWQYFKIVAQQEPVSILEDAHDMLKSKWFIGARFNFAENLLRYQDERIALIAYTEQGAQQELTYQELAQQVAKVSSYLRRIGVIAGDRVAAVLPNGIEAVVAMLASISLGAVWSSCSPDFGEEALLERFVQIKPKILFAVDQAIFKGKTYNLNKKIIFLKQNISSLEKIIIKSSVSKANLELFTADIDYTELLRGKEKVLEFAQLPFHHPLYILYSSGTTGKPKCIVHGAGGVLLQHLKELSLHSDLRFGDRLLFYTTCGWMMWNWQVSALALGITVCLYDGAPMYPNNDSLLDVVDRLKITHFGTSASYLSSLAKDTVKLETKKYASLRNILSTGSPLLPETYEFIYQHIKAEVQVSSISGGSDIISCFILGNPQLPVYKGQLQCFGLGMDVHFYNEHGKDCALNQAGELVCLKSFPSQPVCFWNDIKNNKYKDAYFTMFSGIWAHGDYGLITKEGGVVIQGRSDTVLNPGGVRIGTAEIYQQMMKVQEVQESLVIAQEWQDTQRIILFVVLQDSIELNKEITDKIKKRLLNHASPRHVPKKIIAVKALPKTMNGKLCELAVKNIVHGKEVKNQQSLLNPEVLSFFKNLNELAT